jgi:hypothetical protein
VLVLAFSLALPQAHISYCARPIRPIVQSTELVSQYVAYGSVVTSGLLLPVQGSFWERTLQLVARLGHSNGHLIQFRDTLNAHGSVFMMTVMLETAGNVRVANHRPNRPSCNTAKFGGIRSHQCCLSKSCCRICIAVRLAEHGMSCHRVLNDNGIVQSAAEHGMPRQARGQ